jgi:hypothetical protein
VFAFPDVDGYEEVAHISFANTIENVYKDEESTFALYAPTSQPSGQPSSAPSKSPDKDFPIVMAISVPLAVGFCIISCCILLFCVFKRRKEEKEKDKVHIDDLPAMFAENDRALKDKRVLDQAPDLIYDTIDPADYDDVL